MRIIYHASTNKGMDVIEPRRTLSKNKYIGDYVFATTDKILATMYLATRGYAVLMNSKADLPYIIICADKAEYSKNDEGGAIYELSSKVFTESPQNDLSDYELVCRESVVPLKKTIYDKSLLAMHRAGIAVRFVDKRTLDSLIGNPKQAELAISLPV